MPANYVGTCKGDCQGEMVEAAGVEPASEKALASVPTSVASV